MNDGDLCESVDIVQWITDRTQDTADVCTATGRHEICLHVLEYCNSIAEQHLTKPTNAPYSSSSSVVGAVAVS